MDCTSKHLRFSAVLFFTALLGSGRLTAQVTGTITGRVLGSVDLLELRRTILANTPSDYSGFNKYWKLEGPHEEAASNSSAGQRISSPMTTACSITEVDLG